MRYIYYYFIFISCLSLITFALDKHFAIKGKRRISEKRLHILELLGGVFINILAMYVLRHKNQKAAYFIYTYIILILWVAGIYWWYQGGALFINDYLKQVF